MIGKDKEILQKKLVFLSWLTTVVFMGHSLILAFTAKEFVFWMVLFAFGGLGACFGPWGMITGLITVIFVKQQPQ